MATKRKSVARKLTEVSKARQEARKLLAEKGVDLEHLLALAYLRGGMAALRELQQDDKEEKAS